jgi:hypothetical protein|tara:strand:+ start:367 stop:588 length:222 start_codon:yes stop_codon:yes gene_type:complete
MENNKHLLDLVAVESTYAFTNNDYTDKLTNEIMDYLRNKLNINPNSDKDDIIYSQIWMTISLHNNKIRTNLNK